MRISLHKPVDGAVSIKALKIRVMRKKNDLEKMLNNIKFAQGIKGGKC